MLVEGKYKKGLRDHLSTGQINQKLEADLEAKLKAVFLAAEKQRENEGHHSGI